MVSRENAFIASSNIFAILKLRFETITIYMISEYFLLVKLANLLVCIISFGATIAMHYAAIYPVYFLQ